MPSRELSDSFNRKDTIAEIYLEDVFPSETKGDGNLVSNNLRTGAAQGRSSLVRKVHCQFCGFPFDATKVDHTGGSLDGNGGGGAITSTTTSYTYANGVTLSITAGNQAYSRNSGCPLCFSRNGAKSRRDITMSQPWDRLPNLGF